MARKKLTLGEKIQKREEAIAKELERWTQWVKTKSGEKFSPNKKVDICVELVPSTRDFDESNYVWCGLVHISFRQGKLTAEITASNVRLLENLRKWVNNKSNFLTATQRRKYKKPCGIYRVETRDVKGRIVNSKTAHKYLSENKDYKNGFATIIDGKPVLIHYAEQPTITERRKAA